MTIGVYSMQDLMAARFSTANSIGLDTINAVLQAQIAYDNAGVDQMISDLAQPTESQIFIWGTHTSGEMNKVDEYGHDVARKFLPGIQGGVPLYKFAYELGWTDDYFKRATGAEVAKMYLEVRDAYLNSISAEMMRAVARYSGYTFTDSFTDQTSYAVKRLWDNDGVVPPPSPAGATFVGTHDHYTFATPLTNLSVQIMVDNVEEHGNTKGVKIFIALANKAAFEALTDYTKLTQSFILPNSLGDPETVLRRNAVTTDLENGLIGYWKGGEEVWVKPFMKAKYLMCVATAMDEKVLAYRTPAFAGLKGLRIEAPLPDYPLYAQEMTAQFGFGVLNRGMAAMTEIDATWTADMV